MTPRIEAFYDATTGTFSYVVYAGEGSACAVIDPVLDYDPKSGRTSTAGAERIVAFVREHGLRVEWLLETHAHADHVSAAPYLKETLGGKIAIGESIRIVQAAFKRIFNFGDEMHADGRQFDHLFAPGETFGIGQLSAQALHVPGHTPADMAYRIGDTVFVGDTLFMPDGGSARCDFPGGDARILYESVRTLLALPPQTRLCMCHDYPPDSRGPQWQTTVAEQRRDNIHLHDGVTVEEFVAMRTARDRTLGMPTLILPAIQINIRAGALPEPEANGVRYLKIPLNAF
ncbi:MBL fold metallo-hydrolase [Paraburkholderia sp. 22099]|jgi:glyoxylase-like metal-dependent hydrolase (beta-lactamase superfamily II)|uniref:Glyoxylase, beta-lactamase superfamily II n=1 Tax=Paraburkholderia terricola TaxID=169427 RepID=A0A1M6MWQ9_9BURK|nr:MULTISPECIES: MBL fold metallo-hydrolase [Paraburkholderia]ORC52532.1 MBL fold metallo-hydrolase [Burkholderia sp. A27]MDR6448980.1 glyoxylase-like metal-dependent hydrolase (beta-lactamase superfamily II) [Paraburkholderia terricola]MDR6495091.1 glyoxylase-like metal-dependent hydrolase (beta-lactamase superfamily II) [Paraburkholderia terricola]SDO02750.1 Glyoxylase, beta-lactamase superfamily II [Paraburkholderia sediminicola]SHJ87907.1 Glyoxylase, beta-lactamase superfamily II [Paraburk